MRKMLKHDLKSVWTVWRIMAPVVFATAVICGLAIRFSNMLGFESISVLQFGLLNFIPLFGPFASLVYMFENPFFWVCSQLMNTLPIVFCIITLVLILVRYYKNFFTDEGYLTFTLPVSRAKLVNSKIIMAFFWAVMTILVCLLSYTVFMLCADAPEIAEFLKMIFNNSGSPSSPSTETDWVEFFAALGYVFGYPTLGLFTAVANFMMMLTSITVGSTLVKRAKPVLAIGVYIVATYVTGIISSILTFFSIYVWVEEAWKLSESAAAITGNIFLWADVLFFAALAVGAYFLNLKLIQNKLNLP